MDEQNQSQEAVPAPPRVLLVTSDREQCGIREYGRELMKAIVRVGAEVEIREFPETHPDKLFDALCAGCPGQESLFEIVHLNHHAALHSAWTKEHVEALQKLGFGVIVTQHDTFETGDLMRERRFTDFRMANYLVVHEPVEGLVAGGALMRGDFRRRGLGGGPVVKFLRQPVPAYLETVPPEPRTLGLFGFDFPWKGFEVAIQAAKKLGWRVKVISPNLTSVRIVELDTLYPGGLDIFFGWLDTATVVRVLSGCWATAFPYATGNSGTSGAVRLGIAAKRPLLLSPPEVCRQFRDLSLSWDAGRLVTWVPPVVEAIAAELKLLEDNDLWKVATEAVMRLASLDSWDRAVWTYIVMYNTLQGKVRLWRETLAKRKAAAQ